MKEFSSEWDRSKGYLLNNKNIEKGWNRNFLDTCQEQMKLLRNWTSHDLLSNEIDEKFVGFIFMIGIRSILKLDLKTQLKYEEQLGQLFEQESNPFKKVKSDLAESYFSIRNATEFKFYNPDNNTFSTIVKNYGKVSKNKRTMKKKSTRLIYQMFWHGIFPCFISMPSPSKGKRKDSVPAYINFIDNKLPPTKTFPYVLGQMIFKESF